ncbi:MAG: flagellar hook-basal body complex protein FliE [Pseudolabrys sp.]|nr:flagellar hook-basal body complex protein FliE [Pseudolabrys sp.]MBV9955878.1 flagellar hook-basal body complex protein FliE [Pseudolabrys sp.]
MASPLSAANAYSAISRLTNPAGAATAGQKGDFSALLKEALVAVNEAGKKSDAQTQAVAAGKANIVDVVTAVAETEVAIDAVVAVRDRVIQAYEEIMKMPI